MSRHLMFLVRGSEPLTQWFYSLLDVRDVRGQDQSLRGAVEADAFRWFERLHPGVRVVSAAWLEVPATPEEWKELIEP